MNLGDLGRQTTEQAIFVDISQILWEKQKLKSTESRVLKNC